MNIRNFLFIFSIATGTVLYAYSQSVSDNTQKKAKKQLNKKLSSHYLPLLLVFTLAAACHFNAAAQEKTRVVQMAKLEIDPDWLNQYEQLLKEEIETSLRIEPGVISLQAVAEKNNPTHITIFETYADNDAYQAHLKRPHFLKYKAAVKDMVKHLELVPVNVIVMGLQPNNK